jgi:hypothetical protein
MTGIRNPNLMIGKVVVLVVLFLANVLISSTVLAHGPKGHTEGFTALQAVKKGVEMYDSLCAKGKLKESWETDLDSIEVSTRTSGKQKEFVVKFTKSMGEPKSVYIFFSKKGEYKGSNFTGD